MTQFIGGHHSQPTTLETSSPGQRRQSVGRAGAVDVRNKSITDFFKPAMKQDGAVLSSPGKGHGQAGYSSSEHLKKSMSSSKHNRKKKLSCSSFVKPLPPSRSPIIDAFFQSVKLEKNSSSDNEVYNIRTTKHPVVVVRKLFLSNSSPDILLKNSTYTRSMEMNEKCPVQTRTSLDTRDFLREGLCSTSLESSSDESSSVQTSKMIHSSGRSCDTTINVTESQSNTEVYPDSSTLFGGAKHRWPEKRKRISSKTTTTRKNLSTFPASKMSEQPGSLREGNNSLVLDGCSHEDSEVDGLTEKLKSFSGTEDEDSICSLESSDGEILIPFEKMLSHNAKPAEKSSKEETDKDGVVETHLSKSFVGCGESYINHLEQLLKEKEELLRVDKLENQLQQMEGMAEISSPLKDQSTDGELSAEHRSFIERYTFIDDDIPDQHPGENIFQMANARKLFSQQNLDLRNFGFHPQNLIEKYLLGSEITQQLFLITEGLLISAYHNSPCPIPVLKWMFQMMSIHPDSSVSRKILDMLMTLTVRNASDDTYQQKPWIPSLLDITTVLINMGISFTMLFPLQHFQPSFTEDNIISEMHVTVRKQSNGDICINSTAFFHLIDTSLCNIAKFLRLCINVCPEGYTDKEKDILLLLLFKLSLEKKLKQFPLVDLECLIIKLLENIRDWDNKMPQLCLAISCLSSHHHDLLWLVQFVPNWTTRGRQIRRHLSLVIILKLLKNHVNVPSSYDQQMSLLCKELVKMKPSNLLKNLLETLEHRDGLKEPFLSQFELQAYYLTYVLLHLVREASNFEHTNSNQRKWLLKLCSILEKHVKCDIREDVRLFYRTKVKDLVARTYSKWQQMIHSSPLIQGKIHDFWIPDS